MAGRRGLGDLELHPNHSIKQLRG
ncbi:hypothetical protein CPAR01_09153 [Colletotrichum paranaense]|uniref:Uncharacterized protein n=6 Tax=Colletotrichum acutatum species complex TaxID=2707335 RepID=A0A9Q8SIU5_9PEZI|nr:hypothetical protein CSPX01_12811 [Colletotrichum filicis]KAK1457044.1 hypothetical protein CMEL01_16055 [Colletotrichum melonis]KAK1464436.1 hypothetical protein CCUS01_08009 [Colletotrichum cuscutae]KAK1509921.1 hypothetical protein CTAM01_02044 [Colletotrichum tamarilloi]KAK1525112.1 hypothetical protein CABS01_00201 [Colletotrichum abscissum]KAK1535611.1 hypothetical protein CPAR01_09153 [Colletotrichum paranaense]KAK1537121.1 hypothetical protein CCOS01_02441 [Colletotrichum costarice